MKASIAIQIEPNIADSKETIRVVDEVIDYIRSTGLSYYVGPCETAVEGDDFDQLIEVIRNCVKVANKAGAERVSAYVKLNYRPGGEVLTIDEKVTKHHK
ncbi:MAG: thiamine-binding protein [Candidatus Heteroscillospira sp.]|jgi:uncharacterized protein YqgV (UPF0045/DUF77 family)